MLLMCRLLETPVYSSNGSIIHSSSKCESVVTVTGLAILSYRGWRTVFAALYANSATVPLSLAVLVLSLLLHRRSSHSHRSTSLPITHFSR